MSELEREMIGLKERMLKRMHGDNWSDYFIDDPLIISIADKGE